MGSFWCWWHDKWKGIREEVSITVHKSFTSRVTKRRARLQKLGQLLNNANPFRLPIAACQARERTTNPAPRRIIRENAIRLRKDRHPKTFKVSSSSAGR